MQGEAAEDDTETPGQEAEPLKPFQFLSLAVLREYLAKEFGDADYSCVGGFDLERVIDDFVFMVRSYKKKRTCVCDGAPLTNMPLIAVVFLCGQRLFAAFALVGNPRGRH
jgi:hypothetical protein